MFYYFAHFTKFIPPGSQSVQVDSIVVDGNNILRQSASPMECTACTTPDGQIVIVVQNAPSIDNSIMDSMVKPTETRNYSIHVEGCGYINVEGMKPGSIQTFIVQQ